MTGIVDQFGKSNKVADLRYHQTLLEVFVSTKWTVLHSIIQIAHLRVKTRISSRAVERKILLSEPSFFIVKD